MSTSPDRGAAPRAPLLNPGQLVTSIVAVLALVASVIALALVLPPALRTADPARPVNAYLHAIVTGDVAKALTIGRITPAKGDKLLTDAAYRQSSHRITGFAIVGTSLDGAKGTVEARLTQGGTSYVASFDVERAPGVPVLAPWRLAAQQLPRIALKFSAPVTLDVTVAGVQLTATNGVVSQHVFPGSYEAVPVDSELITAARTTAVARFGVSATPSVMTLALTDAGRSKANDDVAAWVAQCAASTELAPAGCPFRAVPEASVTYSNGGWTVQSQPELTTGDWTPALGGWPVTTSVPGYVTFTAKARQGGLVGTATTGSKPFSVTGTLVPDSSGLRFVPSPAYSSGSEGALT